MGSGLRAGEHAAFAGQRELGTQIVGVSHRVLKTWEITRVSAHIVVAYAEVKQPVNKMRGGILPLPHRHNQGKGHWVRQYTRNEVQLLFQCLYRWQRVKRNGTYFDVKD